MTISTDHKLIKKIKKNIYGKPQSIQVQFPPGLGDAALAEANNILQSLWFPQKYTSQLNLLKNEVRIDQIHVFAATELLIRNFCFSDIRLIISEGKASGKSAFEKKCRDIEWNMFLNKNMSVKIKVDSVASHAFHETGLKEILTGIINDYVNDVVSGEDANPTTTLYAMLYKDRLTVSISLAGNPLYKRGYRGTLSASAPLREDMAACCIQKTLHCYTDTFKPDTIIIPFSGTGTFAFEYLLSHFHISPGLIERDYALTYMPLFRKENFNFLLKKAKEHCLLTEQHAWPDILCIDNSANANAALLENLQSFKHAIEKNNFSLPNEPLLDLVDSNFFDIHFTENKGDVFVLMNPPYGIRIGKSADTNNLYKKIAVKINELAKVTQQYEKSLLGFILCPSQESWSAFCKELKCNKNETYHFTQGGMDIRVCQFSFHIR